MWAHNGSHRLDLDRRVYGDVETAVIHKATPSAWRDAWDALMRRACRDEYTSGSGSTTLGTEWTS